MVRKGRNVRRLQASLSALVMVSVCGCAELHERPRHAVTINTEPAGAACLLTGGVEQIAELPSTPAVVRLPQSPRDVRVFCTSPGHAPVATTLPAETEAKQVVAAALLFGPAPAAIGTMMGAITTWAKTTRISSNFSVIRNSASGP